MNNNDYHYNCEKNLELCMNLECRRDAKFCQYCLANQHYEHQLDCKDVNQLLELIKSSIELQSIFKNELKSQLQILEQIIQDKLSYSSIEIEKLKQIESNLQRGQYLDLRESIKSLKEYNQGKYQKENGEFLTKLKNITQAIKIVTTNTNSQYKNSIEERQHQIPNIQIQTGLIQTNSQLQVQNSQTFQCRLPWESNNHSTQEQQYLNKSIQLINCNSYEDAINFCNDAIKINSQSYQAHVNKGFALSRMQFYDQALNYYEKAIEINSNYFCAYLLKSIILLKGNVTHQHLTIAILPQNSISQSSSLQLQGLYINKSQQIL